MAIASVSVGMAALLRLNPFEMTGSHFILMLRKYMSSMATKKFGSELPMKLVKRMR